MTKVILRKTIQIDEEDLKVIMVEAVGQGNLHPKKAVENVIKNYAEQLRKSNKKK